jgi:hypothetical protein
VNLDISFIGVTAELSEGLQIKDNTKPEVQTIICEGVKRFSYEQDRVQWRKSVVADETSDL